MILNFILGFIFVYIMTTLINLIFIRIEHKEVILKHQFVNMINILYGILAGSLVVFNFQINHHIIIFLILFGLTTYIGHKINKIMKIKDYMSR